MKEHGGWGPRLTFLFFEAAFDLPSRIRDGIGRCRQKTRKCDPGVGPHRPSIANSGAPFHTSFQLAPGRTFWMMPGSKATKQRPPL